MSTKIYWLSGAVALLTAVSLIAPRLFANQTQGLAAGATAAVVFLLLFGLALLLAIWLFVMTWHGRSDLPTIAHFAGLLPLPLLLGIGVAFWLYVQSRGS